MPAESMAHFIVAIAQEVPEPRDQAAALERACELAVDAGHAGARLLVLPEAFIPGYPEWIWTTPLSEVEALATLLAELCAQAITIPGEATDRLCRIARRVGIDLVIGVCEQALDATGPRLYDTLLFFNAAGIITGRQRYLAPSIAERLIWSAADGSTLGVYLGSIGAIGGLIGADNFMPLARYVLFAEGAEIYVAAGHEYGEAWLTSLRHIAREGRVYVIGCSAALAPGVVRQSSNTWTRQAHEPAGGILVSPEGETIELSAHGTTKLLYGEIDLGRIAAARRLNPDGPLARPDVFHLTVHNPMLATPTLHAAEREKRSPVPDSTPQPLATGRL